MNEFERSCDFIYQGNSMKRVFRPGDGVYTEKKDFDCIVAGDVVCFDNGSHMVVHRLVSSDGVTWGDNNQQADLEKLTRENFIGVAVAFRRGSSVRRICNGAGGMRQFKRNQLRMRWRRQLLRFFAPLRGIMNKLGLLFGKVRRDDYANYQLLIWHGLTLGSKNVKSGKISFRPGVLWFFDRKKLVKYFEK